MKEYPYDKSRDPGSEGADSDAWLIEAREACEFLLKDSRFASATCSRAADVGGPSTISWPNLVVPGNELKVDCLFLRDDLFVSTRDCIATKSALLSL